MSNSHVQSAKAIAEDIAHLCCVPDDWRLQISDLAAWPFPTFCAKPQRSRGGVAAPSRKSCEATLSFFLMAQPLLLRREGNTFFFNIRPTLSSGLELCIARPIDSHLANHGFHIRRDCH